MSRVARDIQKKRGGDAFVCTDPLCTEVAGAVENDVLVLRGTNGFRVARVRDGEWQLLPEACRHYAHESGCLEVPKLTIAVTDLGDGIRGRISNPIPPSESLDFEAEVVHRQRDVGGSQDFLQRLDFLEEVGDTSWQELEEVKRLLSEHQHGVVTADVGRWLDDAGEIEPVRDHDPIRILLYGGTGEGKSSVVNALLGMPAVSPSDCAGQAVTSCTVKYSFREYVPPPADCPKGRDGPWAEWLLQEGGWQLASDGEPSKHKRYGAVMRFLSPEAFDAHQQQLVETIAEYWLEERRESIIKPELPRDDKHAAFAALQKLTDWYGKEKVLRQGAGWKSAEELTKYLSTLEAGVEGIQCIRQGQSSPYEHAIEENDRDTFCRSLAEWVTVGSRRNVAHFLSDAQVFLPSPLLKGAELWDVAGLGDENEHRRSMAEKIVQEADFVWVLAKISRAMSNDIAQRMLRNQFRKALLDKSGVGEITFVLTHSDVVNEEEIERSSGGTVRGKTRHELALHRATNVRWKCIQDLQQRLSARSGTPDSEVGNLNPLAVVAGSTLVIAADGTIVWTSADRSAKLGTKKKGTRVMAAGPPLPGKCHVLVPIRPKGMVELGCLAPLASSTFGCFAVSAPDCMRCEGLDVRPPQTFASPAETQIPSLRRQLQCQVLKRRLSVVRGPVKEFCAWLHMVIAHLSDPGAKEEERREKAEAIVREHFQAYKQAVGEALENWEACANSQLEGSLQQKIHSGAAEGRQRAAGTANVWNTHSNYHHATYKGMVRRGCYWQHPNRGELDWAEELAGPVYDKFTTDWRSIFGCDLPAQVDRLKLQLRHLEQTLHEGIAKDIVQNKCRTQAQIQSFQRGVDVGCLVERRCSEVLGSVKAHGMDVSGEVQEQVQRSLKRAAGSCSDRNYATQKDSIKRAATSIKFEESATGLVRGLSGAAQAVTYCRASLESALVRQVEVGYAPLWRQLTDLERAQWASLRKSVLPKLKATLERLEAFAQRCEKEEQAVRTELLQLLPQEPPRQAAPRQQQQPKLPSWKEFLRPAPTAHATWASSAAQAAVAGAAQADGATQAATQATGATQDATQTAATDPADATPRKGAPGIAEAAPDEALEVAPTPPPQKKRAAEERKPASTKKVARIDGSGKISTKFFQRQALKD